MQKDNDINQTNEEDYGFATGVPTPIFRTTGRRPQNLGMEGPNSTRFNNIGFAIRNVSKKVLPANRYRNYLMIQNNSVSNIFVAFGIDVSSANENGFIIPAGGFYELDTRPPFNGVFIKGIAAATQAVLVIEGIISNE